VGWCRNPKETGTNFPDQAAGYLACLSSIPVFLIFSVIWGNEKGVAAAASFACLFLTVRALSGDFQRKIVLSVSLLVFIVDIFVIYFAKIPEIKYPLATLIFLLIFQFIIIYFAMRHWHKSV